MDPCCDAMMGRIDNGKMCVHFLDVMLNVELCAKGASYSLSMRRAYSSPGFLFRESSTSENIGSESFVKIAFSIMLFMTRMLL